MKKVLAYEVYRVTGSHREANKVMTAIGRVAIHTKQDGELDADWAAVDRLLAEHGATSGMVHSETLIDGKRTGVHVWPAGFDGLCVEMEAIV